jgi:hypothetical protein
VIAWPNIDGAERRPFRRDVRHRGATPPTRSNTDRRANAARTPSTVLFPTVLLLGDDHSAANSDAAHSS